MSGCHITPEPFEYLRDLGFDLGITGELIARIPSPEEPCVGRFRPSNSVRLELGSRSGEFVRPCTDSDRSEVRLLSRFVSRSATSQSLPDPIPDVVAHRLPL